MFPAIVFQVTLFRDCMCSYIPVFSFAAILMPYIHQPFQLLQHSRSTAHNLERVCSFSPEVFRTQQLTPKNMFTPSFTPVCARSAKVIVVCKPSHPNIRQCNFNTKRVLWFSQRRSWGSRFSRRWRRVTELPLTQWRGVILQKKGILVIVRSSNKASLGWRHNNGSGSFIGMVSTFRHPACNFKAVDNGDRAIN
jgi:hypothetical protein